VYSILRIVVTFLACMIKMWVFAVDLESFNITRPAQPIRPVRPWPYQFSDSTIRFSFEKRARKMLIETVKSEVTGLYCVLPIHRQLKLNSSTMRRYYILDRRAQTYFEIPMRSVLQDAWMSLWTTRHASRRPAVDWYGLLNATSRQHFDDKSRMLAVLSIFVIENKMLTLCQMKVINQNHHISTKTVWKKKLSWTDRFKQLGLTASSGFYKREMILHSDLYVAQLPKMGRLAFCQMQKNIFYLINLVIVYLGIFRSWYWRHARALHIMIR